MELIFDEYGLIKCVEYFADTDFIARHIFSSKKQAMAFINENPEMRVVCAGYYKTQEA